MPQKNRTVNGVLGGLLGLVGLSVVAGILVTATVTPALAVAGAAGTQALDLFEKLPSYLKPDAPMEPSTFYAVGADGKPVKLATFFDQNRTQVDFDQIAPAMYDAILSSEDKDYYEHGGVNIGATAKALIDNLRGTSSRGASTISQQYVKNVLVQQCEQKVLPGAEKYDEAIRKCWVDATEATGAEGIERKLQEMRYAIQIEKDYSKNEILLGYLNIASFGGTVYGIEAAANYYYGTTAAKLNVNQAATLAGIVQNPNAYRIDKKDGTGTAADGTAVNGEEDGYSRALTRRNYVLDRMLKDGKITQEQHDSAHEAAIEPSIHAPSQGCAAAGNNGYFCQYVKTIVLSDPAFGADRQERVRALQRDGLKIYTSLDLRIQDPAVTALKDRVPANYDNNHFGAAGVTIDPRTGRVLAMTQNTTFRETSSDDQAYSSLVYASDKAHGGSGGFPVGSSYKLFTLLDWLEQGKSVNQSINGRNQVLKFPASCEGTAQTFDTKEVGNFGNSGGSNGTPMTFTRSSLNSGYFAMAAQLDLCDINKMAERLGVNPAKGGSTTDTNVPFNVLGDKYISPLDMAGAYGTVANKGIYCTPTAIDKIVDQSGKELPVPESTCSQVISPEVAATAAYALQGVMSGGGTGSAANPFDGTPVIGKTGSHNSSSTMMIESSTKATTAVYVGRTEGDDSIWGQWHNGNLLQNIRYGIARDMQRAANVALGGGDPFPSPDRDLTRQIYADLPSVVGLSMADARRTLESAGFSVNEGAPVDSEVEAGLVAEQTPGAGRVSSGASVTISPSTGNPPAVNVPNVQGSKFAQAKKTLEDAGFAVSGPGCKGGDEVANQNPAPGQATPPGSSIALTCDDD